jgi:uncharacterized membrane protein YgcG
MEINKIKEKNWSAISQEAKTQNLSGKHCIYYPEAKCSAPKLQFKLCRTCPRCENFVRANVIRSLFRAIIALAILLMKSMGVGKGTGAGTGPGAGGAGGGSGGGGGGGG